MMFRPKFCCNCGDKIERVEWRLWTSRRFCDLCSTEYKHLDILPIAVLCCGAFLSVLGLTFFIGAPNQRTSISGIERPLNTTRQLKPATLYSQTGANTSGQNAAASAENNLISNRSENSPRQNLEQPVRNPATSDDEVFYCGALTKKGTPCTRRVKKKGFCWQHAKSVQIAPARF